MLPSQRVTFEDATSADGEPVLIYNPYYKEYLFVSNQKLDDDNIVESHPETYRGESRNLFLLKKQGTDKCLLFHLHLKRYLFVSNNMQGEDHIVEAHPFSEENRNLFQFQLSDQNKLLYKIYNPAYNEYLFVSNDVNGDHILESHKYQDEDRNQFLLELEEEPKLEHIEFYMDQKKVIKPEIPLADLVVGTTECRNESDLPQSTTIKLDKTESYQTSFKHTHGFSIQGGFKFTGGIPWIFGQEVTITISTTQTFEWTSTATSTCTISGQVTVNAEPHRVTLGTVKIEQQEIEVPYKMTFVTKNNTRFYSYGEYKGVTWINVFSHISTEPL